MLTEFIKSSRGYYEIASSRFLDVICLIAESKLRWKCQSELIDVINSELKVNSKYFPILLIYTH